MANIADEIISRIETLLAEDQERGKRLAHDFIDNLVMEMEALAKERIELEQKKAPIDGKPGGRTELVEEIAARLEKNAGRANFLKELIDSIIERLYRLDPEDRAMLANSIKNKS